MSTVTLFQRALADLEAGFGCPFEGKVDPGSVASDVAKFVSLGVEYVALGDTTGMVTGIDLDRLLATAELCEQSLGRELHGRVTRSGLNRLQ